jgi:hypothetical protein
MMMLVIAERWRRSSSKSCFRGNTSPQNSAARSHECVPESKGLFQLLLLPILLRPPMTQSHNTEGFDSYGGCEQSRGARGTQVDEIVTEEIGACNVLHMRPWLADHQALPLIEAGILQCCS